jgi:hypothetical protein
MQETLTKQEAQAILNESTSVRSNPRQVFSVGMLDAVAQVLKATIVSDTCHICGDPYTEEYLVECRQQCSNVICIWCADDHHGLCCPECLDTQQHEAAADYRFDTMRET